VRAYLPSLHRLMRTLTSLGILTERLDQRYASVKSVRAAACGRATARGSAAFDPPLSFRRVFIRPLRYYSIGAT